MKKLLLMFLTGVITAANAVTLGTEHSLLTCRLSDLSKAWGVLKYHHRGIASGKVNWDSCLLVCITRLTNDSTVNIQNQIHELLQIADKNISSSPVPISPGKVLVSAGLRPGYFLTLTDSLKHMLEQVVKGDHALRNEYMRRKWELLDFSFEKTYTTQFPAVEYRLLGLFRFWNIIEYFYPDKKLMDADWDQVLLRFIPRMMACKNQEEYFMLVSELLTMLDDGHAILMDKNRYAYLGEYEVPVQFKWLDGKMVVARVNSKGTGSKHQIETGDRVVRINGVPMGEKIKDLSKVAPASNEERKMEIISYLLSQNRSRTWSLEVEKPTGVKASVTEKLKYKNAFRVLASGIREKKKRARTNNEITARLAAQGIGYINGVGVRNPEITEAYLRARDYKAIVIDMRGYPGSDVLFVFNRYFCKDQKVFVKYTVADSVLAGNFVNQYDSLSGLSRQSKIPVDKATPVYTGKVVVLVNSNTLSAAEWTVMGLQTQPNVVVVGTRTAGADGNITQVPLPGGFQACFSGLGVEYPDGTQTQRTGLHIDLTVKETMPGLLSGKDEVLETAIDYIKNKIYFHE